jgi:hypothetical protein
MVTTVVKNDKSFTFTFTVKDSDAVVVNLTGYSGVKFKMALPGSNTAKIDGTCTVTDATNGVCTYTVGATDFDTEGIYEAEIQVTYTSGKVITAKLDDFHVIDDLP